MNYRRHFRTRLIIYSALIVTPLLAVLGYNAYASFEQSEKAVLQSVENYSLYIAHDVEDLLLGSERSLRHLAARPAVLALDDKHCDPWLKEFIGFAPEYANLGVITAAGVPVCLAASTPGSVPRSFAGFPWFRHAVKVDGFATSAPFLGPISLKHVSVFSFPLRGNAGQRIGTLALPLELGSLAHFWKSVSLPPGSAIAVFDSDGIFMAGFPDAENWTGKSAGGTLAAALRAAPGGAGVAAGMDGVERAFALKTIPKYGWQVVVGVPTADVFSHDREARTRSLAVIGAVVLFVLFLVTILSRRLSSPLRDLAATVGAVAAGNVSVRANETVSGEFHELAVQFNRMLRMREQAENELRTSEQRLRSFAELGSDWYWEQDANFRFTFISGGLVNKGNFAIKNALGKTRWELPIELGEIEWAAHRATLEAHRAFSDFEYKIAVEDGSARYYSVRGEPLFDDQGRFQGYRGVANDITERKRSEQALRESEERFRDLAELSSDWFWEQDAGLRYTAMSDDFYAKTHFRPSSIIGKLRWELPIVGVSAEQWRAHREVLDRREPFENFVYISVNEAGDLRWFSINGKPLFGPDGGFCGYRGTGQDITERKRVEGEIRRLNEDLEQEVRQRTRELERSNEELEAFSYSVAHDLRTPLRGINGFSAILVREYAGKLDAVAQEYLQRIQSASIRMGEVMDDLLALARAGGAELRRQEIHLSVMAHEVAANLESADPQRQVEFVIAPGMAADADPGLMRIALENLFGNALKFTSNSERARVEFGLTTAEGKPAYFVRDNGVGFDPAFNSKLFQQFQRLHTDKEYEGSGVGLAIVARVIRRHGGRIWAEGAVGQGAVFYFTLG